MATANFEFIQKFKESDYSKLVICPLIDKLLRKFKDANKPFTLKKTENNPNKLGMVDDKQANFVLTKAENSTYM